MTIETNTAAIKDKKIVITIAREYGSGGLTIGKMLAKRLDIPFYDKELLRMASEESGIDEGLFGRNDEKPPRNASLLWRVMDSVYQGQRLGPESTDFTSRENLFSFQAGVIERLAAEEACIIIGRCADYILKDNDNVLSVFVHAPQEYCFKKASEKLSLGDKELMRFIQRMDRERAEYYHYYTGRRWSDAKNYDLCLDSSKLGFDRCVDEIIGYLNIRFDI